MMTVTMTIEVNRKHKERILREENRMKRCRKPLMSLSDFCRKSKRIVELSKNRVKDCCWYILKVILIFYIFYQIVWGILGGGGVTTAGRNDS
jgi:hypothetical protein